MAGSAWNLSFHNFQLMNITDILMISIFLCMIIMSLGFLDMKEDSFSTPVESGFVSLDSTSKKSFSGNFFYVMIMFILFDLELVFLFIIYLKMSIIISFMVVFFLYYTLYEEWKYNNIMWKS